MGNQTRSEFESISIKLIQTGFVIGVIFLILFFIGEFKSLKFGLINADKFGQFGDIVGGVVGSIWALAGVLLFYAAFKKQIEALENQKLATEAAQSAIELQSNELELQRKELAETRAVFQQQEKTLRIQQYESTFFNLLNLYNTTISNMDLHVFEKKKTKDGSGMVFGKVTQREESSYENIKIEFSGRDFFNKIVGSIHDNTDYDDNTESEKASEIIKEHYQSYDTDFEPYYKTLKQLLIRISKCPYDNKQEYIDILSAQVSSTEITLINMFAKTDLLDDELVELLAEYKIV